MTYNWGGSYIHACTGTDNPEHVTRHHPVHDLPTRVT